MAQQLTVITREGHAPRIHTGWMNLEDIHAYIGGLDGDNGNIVITFSHMDVYSDIGDAVEILQCSRNNGSWTGPYNVTMI